MLSIFLHFLPFLPTSQVIFRRFFYFLKKISAGSFICKRLKIHKLRAKISAPIQRSPPIRGRARRVGKFSDCGLRLEISDFLERLVRVSLRQAGGWIAFCAVNEFPKCFAVCKLSGGCCLHADALAAHDFGKAHQNIAFIDSAAEFSRSVHNRQNFARNFRKRFYCVD